MSLFSFRCSWLSFTSKSWSVDDLLVFFKTVFLLISLFICTGTIVCYVLLGTPAGYTSARFYKSKILYVY
jgi:ABC-type glycerol-3-phosphate transport system permease component